MSAASSRSNRSQRAKKEKEVRFSVEALGFRGLVRG